MPNRIIREGILTSERVNKLDWPEEVFYRRLMSVVDDFGLFDGRPSVIRAAIYQLKLDQVREADVSRWIAACVKAGLVRLYSAQGKDFIQMVDVRWQARSKSKWPLPPQVIEDGQSCAQLISDENNCAQLRTYAHAHSDAHSDAQAQARPGGPGVALDIDDEIRAWFSGFKGAMYSPKAHAAMRRIVSAFGWETAEGGVTEAVAGGATDPFAWAEKVLNARHAQAAARQARATTKPLQKARVYTS